MRYQFGNFTLFITEDYEHLSEKSASLIAEQINEKPTSVMGFATGGTPVGTYKELIKLNKAGGVDFSKITAFNLDEYYPIKKTNDQSYDYFMKDNLFNHVNISKDKLRIPNGEAGDINAECLSYEKQIKEAGGIDFQLLGIGLNGHIGFNEPDESFAAQTHHVTLDRSTIEANSRFFSSVDDVPKQALTMGIKTIMMAKKILLVINSEKKAAIVKETLFGRITPAVPASALQMHQNVLVVLDKPAASKIINLL